MVKQIKLLVFLLLLSAVCFIGCNIDLPGLVIANDLDDRLKERDNFKFLDGKNSKGENRNWRTLNEGTDYSFIVISDTHIENGEGLSKDKKIYLGKLADITNNNKNIKFVVITGDITQNATVKDFDKFIEIADSLGVPCYPIAGNHDVYYRDSTDKGWTKWRDIIGSTNYRIDGNSTTLFILDTANAFFGKEQLDWLEREINSDSIKSNVFVFAHAPLFVVGPVDMQQSTDTKERARLLSILRDKCDIMFMGHLHKHMVNKAGGVEYLSLASFIDESAYYIVTVSPSGIKWERKVFLR